MKKRILSILLAGLMVLPGGFTVSGEELLAAEVPIVSEEGFEIRQDEIQVEEEIPEAVSFMPEAEEDLFIDEESELILDEEDAFIDETEEDLSSEDEVLEELTDESAIEPDPASDLPTDEQIEESAPTEDIPSPEKQEDGNAEDSITEEDSSNSKKQIADGFKNIAGLIVSGMSSPAGEPDMVGYSQLTKNYVSQTLKNYIMKNGKVDEEGDYYITVSQNISGVTATSNIYYVVAYNEFFFEIIFNETVEGVSYVSTTWMSLPYGATSGADISYFLDVASTGETYVSASSEIPTPSKYSGVENIEFEVQELDQDLMDYEIQDLANVSLKAGFAMWNSILLDKVKVSMQTLGFDGYRMTHTHDYAETIYSKATESSDGSVRVICKTCGNIKSNTVVKKIASYQLNVTKFIYNNTVQKPNVVVRDSDNKVINSSYINISFTNPNSKAIGTYTVKVTMKGRYSGTKTLSYQIAKATASTPPQPKLVAAYNSIKGIGVQFYKVDKAKQYVIFRKYKGSWNAIRTIGATDPLLSASGSKLLYIDESVKNDYGEGYIYSVAAKVGSELSSYDAAGVAIYRLAPPRLTGVKKASATSATVTWNKTTALGYELQYCVAGQSTWKKCPQTKGLTQTATGLKAGTRYCFRVRCYKTNSVRGTYYSYYSNYLYLTM